VPEFFAKMTDLYDGTLQVEVTDIVAGDDHGVVLARESGTVHGDTAAWTSAHVWSFDRGHATRLVVYVSAEYQRFWAGNRMTANR
jgi:hypothetical protein